MQYKALVLTLYLLLMPYVHYSQSSFGFTLSAHTSTIRISVPVSIIVSIASHLHQCIM
jgi:hypothetical protein